MKKNSSAGLIITVIMVMIAVLLGFGIWLGNKLASELSSGIVGLWGIEGPMAYVVMLIVVILAIIFLSFILAILFHRKINVFKRMGKIYGM